MENCLPPSTALVCKLLERVLISFQHIMTMDLPSKYTINIHCPFDLHSALALGKKRGAHGDVDCFNVCYLPVVSPFWSLFVLGAEITASTVTYCLGKHYLVYINVNLQGTGDQSGPSNSTNIASRESAKASQVKSCGATQRRPICCRLLRRRLPKQQIKMAIIRLS